MSKPVPDEVQRIVDFLCSTTQVPVWFRQQLLDRAMNETPVPEGKVAVSLPPHITLIVLSGVAAELIENDALIHRYRQALDAAALEAGWGSGAFVDLRTQTAWVDRPN